MTNLHGLGEAGYKNSVYYAADRLFTTKKLGTLIDLSLTSMSALTFEEKPHDQACHECQEYRRETIE